MASLFATIHPCTAIGLEFPEVSKTGEGVSHLTTLTAQEGVLVTTLANGDLLFHGTDPDSLASARQASPGQYPHSSLSYFVVDFGD